MAAPAAGQDAELSWLALVMVPGLGARNALKLIRNYGSAERIFHASLSELLSCGVRRATAEAISSGLSFDEAADQRDRARAAGAEIVTIHDERYPAALKEIFDPPVLLFVRGDVGLLGSASVGVVGTRRPSAYGRAVAERLGQELAESGLAVVSGMARGVDGLAHRGALAAGGDTVAVLGCGVDVVYPKEHRALLADVAEKGAVVSEFPMGSFPAPQNFPIRNRIISGASAGVLVVEAAQYSGSLITARLALDQGREVFAVPGNITNKASWGTNLLIKQGAQLVQSADDVVEALPQHVREVLPAADVAADGESAGAEQKPLFGQELGPLAETLLGALRVDESMHIDAVIRECDDTPPAKILAKLSELELFGAVRQLPGKYFVRVW